MTMTATAPHAIQPSTPVSESSSRCSGDFACLTDESIEAIWPIWVVMPVSVITTVAVPLVTCVFWNTEFARSPSVVSGSAMVAASFAIGALSPVRAASCVSRVAERRIRPSAGTMSPASRATMSPGTTSVEAICSSEPSRKTRAFGICIFDRASTEALAFISWLAPRNTFRITSAPTTMPTLTWSMRRLMIATMTSMTFIGSASWLSDTCQSDGGFSAAIALGPCSASRRAASACVSPRSRSVPRAATTASGS